MQLSPVTGSRARPPHPERPPVFCPGSLLGSVIVLLAGGFLCQTIGWPSIFYIFGELELLRSQQHV